LWWQGTHLLAIITTLGALAGGLRIATLDHPWVMRMGILLPQGDMHSDHILWGALALSAALSLGLLGRRPSDAWDKALFWLGMISIGAGAVSGGLLYYVGDRAGIAPVHFTLAIGTLLYLVLHLFRQGITRLPGRILTALHAPSRPTRTEMIALGIPAGLFVLFWWGIGPDRPQRLPVAMLPKNTRITIDGLANETAWQQAPRQTIHAYGGANFFGGATTFTVRALRDRHNIYFFITWRDPTQSLLHLPLVKGPDGWKVKENGFYRYDEVQYYEDKLAILLSNDCTMGAGRSAHLGHRPLSDRPANWHHRGYHYTTDGTIRDLWQWKAVRSDPMQIADDDFFGAPAAVLSGQRRYKAGYIADGKDSGGISMNWQWYAPHGITPKKLPDDTDRTTISPTEAVPWYAFVRYTRDRDTYREGAMLPSVLLKANTIEGDQADVGARGVWRDGWWHLELVRALDTHSPNDLPIRPGICLWVSAFDHAQVRHTRHARPLQLIYSE